MDDDEALPGDAQATGPWTIKGVPFALRREIIAEARKEGATVTAWLERRMVEWRTIVKTQADQGALVPVGPKRDIGQTDPIEVLRVALDLAETLDEKRAGRLRRAADKRVRKLLAG